MKKIKLLSILMLVCMGCVTVSARELSGGSRANVVDGINITVQVLFDDNMPQSDGNIKRAVPDTAYLASGSPYGDIFTWRDETYKNYRRGYTFTGWNTMKDGTGTSVTASSIVPEQAVVTLYAQWTPVTMQVTFNTNGGAWVDGANNQPTSNPFTVTYGTLYRNNTTYNWKLPVREGYVFLGWNTSANADRQFFGPDALVSLTSDHTLYAIWAEMPEISIPETMEVCYDKPATMCAPVNFSGYSWSPTTGLSDPNSRCPIIDPTKMTSNEMQYQCLYTLGNIYNYDFTFGNKGFSTDYDILEDDPAVQSELVPERKVSVVSCWNNVHHTLDPECTLASFEGDKASGGKFLAINGGEFPNEVVWEQTAACAHNTTYEVSAYVARAYWEGHEDQAPVPAKLLFYINGVRVSPDTMVVTNLNWVKMSATWESNGSDFATICIKDYNTIRGGNDFAIDHIQFRATSSLTLAHTVNVVRMDPFNAGKIVTGKDVICTGSSVQTIGNEEEPTGGIEPYSYQWYVSVNGGEATAISGATSATYTPNEYKNTLGTYVFTRKAKDSKCAELTSSEGQWTLEVKQGLVIDACPEDMTIELWMDTPDTMVTAEMAGIQVFYDAAEAASIAPSHLHITHNLASLNRMPVGEHIVRWTVTDDCGNVAKVCNQKITVVYPPCVGTTYQGHKYEAVRIGYQCWFTENLRNDNDPEGNPVENKHPYGENPDNTEPFGDLYSWYSAVNVPEGDDTAVPVDSTAENGSKYVMGICPPGWAVASGHDWDVLNDFAGDVAYLKDKDAQYWTEGANGIDPNLGFYSRGSGRYNSALMRYEDKLSNAYYWRSDSTPNSTTVTTSELNYYCGNIMPKTVSKTDLQSIRCLKKKRFEEE